MTEQEQWKEIVRRLEALPSRRLLRAFYACNLLVCAVGAVLPQITRCDARLTDEEVVVGDVDIANLFEKSPEVRELVGASGFDLDTLETLQAWNDDVVFERESTTQRYERVLDRARLKLAELTRGGTP